MRCVAVALLAGCTAAPAPPTPFDGCPDCAAGEARFALAGPPTHSAGPANLAVRDGGFAYVAGDSIYLLDDELAIAAHHRVDNSDQLTLAVASSGDASYVLEQDPRVQSEDGKLRLMLHGYDADANELWLRPLAAQRELPALVADVVGPYVGIGGGVTGIDRDGNIRASFSAALPASALGSGGVITVESSGNVVIVADLFPTGPARWAKIWRTDGEVRVVDVTTTATRIAVVGELAGTMLDLDGTQLPGGATTIGFVAVLSIDGTLQWATALPRPALQIAMTTDDQVVIGGTYDDAPFGLPPADRIDSYVAIVDRTGLLRADALGGHGDQTLAALRAGPDGTVVVTLASESGELVTGTRTLSHAGARDYVVELAP